MKNCSNKYMISVIVFCISGYSYAEKHIECDAKGLKCELEVLENISGVVLVMPDQGWKKYSFKENEAKIYLPNGNYKKI